MKEKKLHCEGCGEFISYEDYYSVSNCDDTGKGVALCKPCADIWEKRLEEEKPKIKNK